MIRPVYINSKVALAFAAVVIAGAAFIATNFEGVKDRPEPGPDYAGITPQAEPEAAMAADHVEPAEGWYDDADLDGPIDDAQGFDPAPALSTDPGAEDYVVLEGEPLPPVTDGGELVPDGY